MNIKNKNISSCHKFLIISIISSVIIIVVLILLIIFQPIRHGVFNAIIHDKTSTYLFTNPILDCEINNQDENSIVFSDSVIKKVQDVKDKYSLDHISLYYRDLNNGPWVGVNEKEVFSPASLLKVPILIEFLHEAENNPSLLNKEVEVTGEDINKNVTQNIKFDGTLEVGKKYTLEKIAESMIDKSDNTAVLALMPNINALGIGSVFNAVGVPFKDTSTEVDVRVKDYAGFFRVLFNASYLSRDMSEKALAMLSKSEYKEGIVAGVPPSVIVSHKFGERSLTGDLNEDKYQLHDCGIVYYPGKPYIICIMTRGNNFKTQGESIKELSSFIYKEVDKNSK